MAVILVLTTKLKKKKNQSPVEFSGRPTAGRACRPRPLSSLSVECGPEGYSERISNVILVRSFTPAMGNYRTIRLFSMYVSHAASQCHEPLGPPFPLVFPGSPLRSRRPSALCPRLSPQSRGQRLVCIRGGAEGWGSGSPHTTLSARCGQGGRRGKNVEVCNDARCSAGRRGCPEPGRLTLPAVRKA